MGKLFQTDKDHLVKDNYLTVTNNLTNHDSILTKSF